MNNLPLTPTELLERATNFGNSHTDMGMIDLVTLLRGYVNLTLLDPFNTNYREYAASAATALLEAAHKHPEWHQLVESEQALPVAA